MLPFYFEFLSRSNKPITLHFTAVFYSCEQVGDAGPILDAMAVMLENISNITVITRTMICVVYHTAQIVASIPNPSYLNKVMNHNHYFFFVHEHFIVLSAVFFNLSLLFGVSLVP